MKRIFFASLTLSLTLCLCLMVEADDYGRRNPPPPAVGIGNASSPDLVVQIAGPRQAEPGDEIGRQISVRAGNRGDAAAPGTDGRIDPDNGYMIDIVLSTDGRLPDRPATVSRDFREDMLLIGGRISRTADLAPRGLRDYSAGAEIPRNAPPGRYFICARIDSFNRVAESDERNNTTCFPIQIRQPAPPAVGVGGDRGDGVPHYHRGGVTIERINPDVTSPGRAINIYGRNFGSVRGEKIVGINRGRVNRMEVLDWSDDRIRARVPDRLASGNYRVLIYYDDSFRTSSNSLEVTIEQR
jgi:CARDB